MSRAGYNRTIFFPIRMELIPLAKKQTQDGEEQEELSSGDSLKLDLYFWLQIGRAHV